MNIKPKQDRFATIAASGIGGAPGLLVDPQPPKITHRMVPIKMEGGEPFVHPAPMETEEQLKQALRELRDHMKPFLEKYTRPVRTHRTRIPVEAFTVDGKEVTLPHFEGPVGHAKKEYRAFFTVDGDLIEREQCGGERMLLHFEGVDYTAEAYVNGIYVGSHEGFFSPFEFDVTEAVRPGENELRVIVRNDFIYMGNDTRDGEEFEGDKLYAATGLGWDDPAMGWHHCPPGMGIYGQVYLEQRAEVYLSDLAVRPLPDEKAAEVIAEVTMPGYGREEITLGYEIEGLNFKDGQEDEASNGLYQGSYQPHTVLTVGRGDSLTEAFLQDKLATSILLKLQHGVNVFTFRVPMENFRTWEPEAPYLYEARVALIYRETEVDEQATVFGMRSFTQDTEHSPKGMFYLNHRPIRLRGANTMGFEQQDVLRKDYDQLVDDILYAKLCHMNFLRITQRPVQKEVYEYCDRLGLMVQTDLPLFGCMRRTKFCEGIRQAEEMERLIRSHASCILVTYINEPFPNADNEPHRHLERHELESFFAACDAAVHLQNPDRVTKHVDGDYDPPCDSMPDNHCYPMWYNAHGLDIGLLHRGYWLSVRPDWYYGCGEYGSEALDSAEVMDQFYPKEWLAEPFDPRRIVRSQTGSFHTFFYDRPRTREEWIEASQSWQALATGMMTEAFRRDNRMISQAIHLFIDAWPAGWMKSIMDCGRHPKKAYFAYRDALAPRLLSLRTDRFTYYCGETVSVEAWLCNDTAEETPVTIRFELYQDQKLMGSAETEARMGACSAAYGVTACFTAPDCEDRCRYELKAILLDETGAYVGHSRQSIEVFRHVDIPDNPEVTLITDLPVGEQTVDGCRVKVKAVSMLPLHFASRDTGHEAMASFRPDDFRFWYHKEKDCIAPIVEKTFTAEGFAPMLLAGNTNDRGEWTFALAAAERKDPDGHRTVITTVDLRKENPVAERFLAAIYRKTH